MAQDQVAGPPKPKEVEYDENGEIIGAPRTHQQIAAQKRMEMTKAQVDEVVDIMKTNYEKVLERDVKLSELDDRADALEYGASQFEQQAKSLKNKFWLQNLKMMLIMGAIGIVIIGLLYVRYSGSSPVAAVTGGGAPAGGVAAAPAAGAGVAGAGVVAAPVDNAGGTPAPSHCKYSPTDRYSGSSPVAAAAAHAADSGVAGAGVVAAPVDNAGGTPAPSYCKYSPTVRYSGSSPVAGARRPAGWRSHLQSWLAWPVLAW